MPVSSFQAQFLTQKNTEDNCDALPAGSDAVLNSTYMDDTLDSAEDDHSAIELNHQLT